MTSYLTIAVLAVAGVALVTQNMLMVRITESVSTVVITLVINSAVGLVLLLAILLFRNGMAGIGETFNAARFWFLLPGLLGSFFIFAGIMGYQKVGATATISVLVASQLLAGLIADELRAEVPFSRISQSALLGAGLLIIGAFLVARERV